MLILFDQSAPAPLRAHLPTHVVTEARDRGWDRLVNGELLNRAEAAEFEVFITADKNLRYQQNLTGRKIAIVVIGNAQWRVLRNYVDRIVSAVQACTPGSYTEVDIPFQ
jgi:predicted nuclease of predicted toxin-antitoxin system